MKYTAEAVSRSPASERLSAVFRFCFERAVRTLLLPPAALLAVLLVSLPVPAEKKNAVFFTLEILFLAGALITLFALHLSVLYRAFPREKDGLSKRTLAGIVLSFLLSLFLLLLAAFLLPALAGLLFSSPPALKAALYFFAEFFNVFTLIFLSAFLSFSALFFLLTLSVLLGKRLKKRKNLSRTCVMLVLLATATALVYVFGSLLLTYADISALERMAEDCPLGEGTLWVLFSACCCGLLCGGVTCCLAFHTAALPLPRSGRRDGDKAAGSREK